MKKTPILFIPLMAEQILAGNKTMTRRVVKPQLEDSLYLSRDGSAEYSQGTIVKCPYGQVGDVLWVKETFYAYGHWEKNGKTKTGKQKWKFVRDKKVDIKFEWKADTLNVLRKNSDRVLGWYKRSALFMEQDMARIRLRITNKRVERLQDISEEDAIKEGIEYLGTSDLGARWKSYKNNLSLGYLNPVYSFMSLWESINGEESLNENPFVYVIEFERIEKPLL